MSVRAGYQDVPEPLKLEDTVSTQVSEQQARQVAEAAREQDWKLPSFGKELFLGNFRLDLIHPQPKLNAEAVEKGEAFLRRLRTFLTEHVDPLEIERESKIPDSAVDGLKQLGALGMKVPEQYGGLGLSQVYYNRALALAGTWHSSLATLLSAHQSIGVAEPLMLFGSDEQKQKWLPLVAKDHISAFLLTEPDVGSDPARLGSTATPTQGGYLLNGRKLWATNGAIADIVVVMAQVPKEEGRRGGISAFVLDYSTEGVTVESRNAFMGLRGIENSVTRLENVFVPEENLIGKEGMGLKIALSTLNTGRLALPAICVGNAKWATKVSREWSKERVQWGQPVGKHDAVAQKIAYIAATAFGLEAMLDVSSRLADDKKNDIRIEAAIAKLYASENGWQVLDQLMQVAGEILEGDGDLSTKAKAAVGAGKFYAKWLPGLTVGDGLKPGSYDEFGSLATHLRFVERHSRKLARTTFYAMGRWQAKLEKKQAFLGRIVDIGAELYAIASAATYANTIKTERPDLGEEAYELADLFCKQARGRVDRLFDELWSNNDDDNYAAAQAVLDGRFTWVEEGIADPSGDGPMIAPQPDSVDDRAGAPERAPTQEP